jgi:hypothetical protein
MERSVELRVNERFLNSCVGIDLDKSRGLQQGDSSLMNGRGRISLQLREEGPNRKGRKHGLRGFFSDESSDAIESGGMAAALQIPTERGDSVAGAKCAQRANLERERRDR